MTMATDLAAFLLARLDDDEHYVRVMTEVGKRKAEVATPQDEADAYGFAISILSDPEATKILEQWCDGAVLPPNHNDRLLTEIAAKRAIVRRCASRADELDVYPNGLVSPRALLARQTLMDLGAAYSDHPDYRPEWKP